MKPTRAVYATYTKYMLMIIMMIQFRIMFIYGKWTYLCETSPVVTTDEVDITFLPATSTASQTLSAEAHTKRLANATSDPKTGFENWKLSTVN